MGPRINLLPPEITEKRKSEGRRAYIVVAFLLVLGGLGIAYALLSMQVSQREREVARLEQEAADLRAEAERFAVFEERRLDLDARSEIADAAMVGAIDWARLWEELSLVLPTDLWMTAFSGDRVEGLTIDGKGQDPGDDVPDLGHKSIARLMVRLADLDQLSNVWLSDSQKVVETTDEAEFRWIEFSVTASVPTTLTDDAGDSAGGVPAPPNESGQ